MSSPTQSDKTVEEILDHWAVKHLVRIPLRAQQQNCQQELIAALTAREERLVREARLDENQRIARIWVDAGIHAPQQIENRIERLTKENP